MRKESLQNAILLNNNFLNFIPLICSFMVVQIHSYNIGNLSKTSISALIISFFSHGLCTTAVPIFFFISGYLFFKNIDTVHDVFKKQKRRIITVLLPFIAWSAFYLFVYSFADKFVPSIATTVSLTFGNIVKGILFYQYNFPLWYMFQLLVFILLSILIFYILKTKYLIIITLLATSFVGLFFSDCTTICVGGLERSLFQANFFTYYLLGCIFAKSPTLTGCFLKLVRKINIIFPIFSLILFSILESLFFEKIIPSFNERCMVPFVFLSFLILALKICETKVQLPKSKVSTMVIYGIHSIVGIFLGRLILSNLNIPIILGYFLSTLLTFIISFIIGYVLKTIRPIYYIFSGNR